MMKRLIFRQAITRRDIKSMRILLTGASSFTGYWIASALAKADYKVTATFRGSRVSYREQRGMRISRLEDYVEAIWDTSFGDCRFMELAHSRPWDLLFHHGAHTANYRSQDFDALAATESNCQSMRSVLTTLAEKGCAAVLVTGSVFEPFEGVGDPEHRAFSPYALSKHFTFEIFRYETRRLGMALGKFVIPNPFGPMEDRARFTSYLAREWSAGRVPSVATPFYIRDNIHVDLLALEAVSCCEKIRYSGVGVSKTTPSGYIESQGAFARRFAAELSSRLGRDLPLNLVTQKDFPEPLIRTNCALSALRQPGWSEPDAWDQVLSYYKSTFDL
jgi:UDP-glucose 4-epimerase